MSAARWYSKRPSEHDLSLRPSDFQRDQTNVAAARGGSGAQGHSAGIQAVSACEEPAASPSWVIQNPCQDLPRLSPCKSPPGQACLRRKTRRYETESAQFPHYEQSSRAKEGGSERFRGFGELVREGIGGLGIGADAGGGWWMRRRT